LPSKKSALCFETPKRWGEWEDHVVVVVDDDEEDWGKMLGAFKRVV
jgi:hypothetical protein